MSAVEQCMLCGDHKLCCVEHVTHKIPHTCHNTLTLTMVDADPALIEIMYGGYVPYGEPPRDQ